MVENIAKDRIFMCRIELFDKYAWPNNAKFDKGEIIRAIVEICGPMA